MIAALARASQALEEPSYQDAAKRSADFVLTAMRENDGRLYRRYRLKQAYLPNKVLLFRGKDDAYKELDKIAPYAGKMASAVSDRPTAFWCQQFSCQEPITSIEKLESVITSA